MAKSAPIGRRAAIRPVGVESTVNRVAAEIRQALLAGELAPGVAFSTAGLSTQLNVSHVPVREALRRFEAQGLLSMPPGRQAYVTPLDGQQLVDVQRLWILLCEDVAARACVKYSDDDLAAAERKLDAFTALPQTSAEAFELHQEFHMDLLAPGMSSWDRLLLDILWAVMERAVRIAYRGMERAAAPGDAGAFAYQQHRPLLDAAGARDVVRLQRELRHHHESHLQAVLDALAADAGDATS